MVGLSGTRLTSSNACHEVCRVFQDDCEYRTVSGILVVCQTNSNSLRSLVCGCTETAHLVSYCQESADAFVSQALLFCIDHASVGKNWKGRSGSPLIPNGCFVAFMRATINDERLDNTLVYSYVNDPAALKFCKQVISAQTVVRSKVTLPPNSTTDKEGYQVGQPATMEADATSEFTDSEWAEMSGVYENDYDTPKEEEVVMVPPGMPLEAMEMFIRAAVANVQDDRKEKGLPPVPLPKRIKFVQEQQLSGTYGPDDPVTPLPPHQNRRNVRKRAASLWYKMSLK